MDCSPPASPIKTTVSEQQQNTPSITIDENHIKVVCRVRPVNSIESSHKQGLRKCITVVDDGLNIQLTSRDKREKFHFDCIADEETSQEDMFALVGKPITDACVQGFNGTIICYGQTGSGKSHTIFGSTESESEERGLVPRVIDYLYNCIDSTLTNNSIFTIHCSFYEIYQERVFDLLLNNCNDNISLNVREDSKRGVYVEGVTIALVQSRFQVHVLIETGCSNRRIGETAMNRDSSRSHAVFTLFIDILSHGIHMQSKFIMVDLAGSERQKYTSAKGERLKEAGMINKSLFVLGTVIKALSEKTANKQQHIHYRDSKLTFLLRDSLGGNAKTVLIATVSPVELSAAETQSTLQFAQRAKRIRNAAVVNEDAHTEIQALQKEVQYLRNRLASAASEDESLMRNNSMDSDSVFLKGASYDSEDVMLAELDGLRSELRYYRTKSKESEALLQSYLASADEELNGQRAVSLGSALDDFDSIDDPCADLKARLRRLRVKHRHAREVINTLETRQAEAVIQARLSVHMSVVSVGVGLDGLDISDVKMTSVSESYPRQARVLLNTMETERAEALVAMRRRTGLSFRSDVSISRSDAVSTSADDCKSDVLDRSF